LPTAYAVIELALETDTRSTTQCLGTSTVGDEANDAETGAAPWMHETDRASATSGAPMVTHEGSSGDPPVGAVAGACALSAVLVCICEALAILRGAREEPAVVGRTRRRRRRRRRGVIAGDATPASLPLSLLCCTVCFGSLCARRSPRQNTEAEATVALLVFERKQCCVCVCAGSEREREKDKKCSKRALRLRRRRRFAAPSTQSIFALSFSLPLLIPLQTERITCRPNRLTWRQAPIEQYHRGGERRA
jgi:hypothetical protein